jgi:hypothetical protein
MQERDQYNKDLTLNKVLCRRCGQIGHYPNYCLEQQIPHEEFEKRYHYLKTQSNQLRMMMNPGHHP